MFIASPMLSGSFPEKFFLNSSSITKLEIETSRGAENL